MSGLRKEDFKLMRITDLCVTLSDYFVVMMNKLKDKNKEEYEKIQLTFYKVSEWNTNVKFN